MYFLKFVYQSVSEYEQLRLDNIARNEEMMKSLGLGSCVVKPHKVKASKARKYRSQRYRSEDSDSDYQEEEEEEIVEERAATSSGGPGAGGGTVHYS